MIRNLLFSLFAITLATIAAMAATTFVLNTPVRTGPPVALSTVASDDPRAAPTAPAASLAQSNEQGTPAPEPAQQGETPDESAPPATGTATPQGEPQADKDPYEGLTPEEVPPDLQYSADSSVSFPTNI